MIVRNKDCWNHNWKSDEIIKIQIFLFPPINFMFYISYVGKHPTLRWMDRFRKFWRGEYVLENIWRGIDFLPLKGGYPSQLLTKIPKITSNFPKKISSGVFTCSILASIVTILESIVVILTSIDPILEKCGYMQVQYSQVLSQ